MPMTNQEIARVFEEMGALLEMKDDSMFKVRAYQRAARTMEQLTFQVEQAVAEGIDLKEIPGIGKAIDEKIHELLQSGKVAAHQRLLAELPDGVLTLMTIPGIGPKTAMGIAEGLGVSTVDGVEKAILEGKLAELPRMGQKTAEKVLRHIRSLRLRGDRVPIGHASPLAEQIISDLGEKCPEIQQLWPAGSLRRWEETIGDIDLMGTSLNPEGAIEALVSLPMVREVLGHGPTKASVVVNSGIQVDLRMVEPDSWGALIQYFTGSKQHNILLRDYANSLGLSLNEYGITDLKSGDLEKFGDEESFYARLGLPYIPPELRVGMNELELARAGKLPQLIQESLVRGDLHVHSDWTDGREPIEVMVEYLVEQGHEYMAITDHSVGRGVANGMTTQRLQEQINLLRGMQRDCPITLLCGSEVDIRSDGSLDYPDEVLAQLDVVVASVHSAMDQDRQTMTRRIIGAMDNPYVTIIGHLTTRLLGRRDPIEFDLEAVLQAARKTGTALEINCSPDRMDLKDSHAYRARELGVPLVINTDSHHHTHFANRRFGVAVARRAWCEPQHILNALPRDQFLSFIRSPKPDRIRVFQEAWAAAGSTP